MANLIEAWEGAKDGQKMKRKNPLKVSITKRHGHFIKTVNTLSDEDRYANDWVLVVPKKADEPIVPKVQSGVVEWFRNEDGYKIPVSSLEEGCDLNFDALVGKRTKITIEVL